MWLLAAGLLAAVADGGVSVGGVGYPSVVVGGVVDGSVAVCGVVLSTAVDGSVGRKIQRPNKQSYMGREYSRVTGRLVSMQDRVEERRNDGRPLENGALGDPRCRRTAVAGRRRT